MDKTYLLIGLDFNGIRRPITTAPTRSDLAAIADKLVTAHVKKGYLLTDVVEALEPEENNLAPVRVYVLVKPGKRKSDPPADLARLELYELPIDTADTYKVDLYKIWNF